MSTDHTQSPSNSPHLQLQSHFNNNIPDLKVFQMKVKTLQNTFNQSSEIQYYILSKKFIAQWKQYNQPENNINNQLQKNLPQPFNQDIIQRQINRNNQFLLKQNLKENQDYIIIDKSTMDYIQKHFQGTSIKRKAFIVNKQKQVHPEIFPFEYIIINQQTLQSFFRQQFSHFPIQTIYTYKLQPLHKFHLQLQQNTKNQFTRLWMTQQSLQEFEELLKQQNKLSLQNGKKISISSVANFLSQQKNKDYRTVSFITNKKPCLFILQTKQQPLNNWIFKDQQQGKCSNCDKNKKIYFECQCKLSVYCSQICRNNDQRRHKRKCIFLKRKIILDIQPLIFDRRSKKGLVGLINLMNTCYFNSCLQCLSHTYPLTKYFIFQNIKQHINLQNPIGSGGIVAKQYSQFIRAMWCNSDFSFAPKQLKAALSSMNHIFLGFGQQDSHQAFNTIIDTLNEDLNLIKQKPYIQNQKEQVLPDQKNFKKFWLNFLKRNQSIIVDQFTGIYKSVVACSICQHVSTTFQSYVNLTLPVITEKKIQNKYIKISFFYVYKNYIHKTQNFQVYVQKKFFNYQYLMKKIGDCNQKTHAKFFDKRNLALFSLSLNGKIEQITSKTCNFQEIISLTQDSQKSDKYLFCFQCEKIQLDESYMTWYPITFNLEINGKKQRRGLKRPIFVRKQFQYAKVSSRRIVKKSLQMMYQNVFRCKIKPSKSDYLQQYTQKWEKVPFTLYFGKKNTPLQQMQQATQLDEFDDDENVQFALLFYNQAEFDITYCSKYSKKQAPIPSDLDAVQLITTPFSDIYQCFKGYEQEDNLQNGNQWYCSSCKQHCTAKKKISIYQTPKILVIHLNRFKQKKSNHRQKMDSLIQYPLQLDITDFITKKQPIITNLKQFQLYCDSNQEFLKDSLISNLKQNKKLNQKDEQLIKQIFERPNNTQSNQYYQLSPDYDDVCQTVNLKNISTDMMIANVQKRCGIAFKNQNKIQIKTQKKNKEDPQQNQKKDLYSVDNAKHQSSNIIDLQTDQAQIKKPDENKQPQANLATRKKSCQNLKIQNILQIERIETQKEAVQKRVKYSLYGVSNHYGTINAGHYTAYVNNKGKWYQMNDSQCRQIKSDRVQARAAYMLFYERID